LAFYGYDMADTLFGIYLDILKPWLHYSHYQHNILETNL